MRGNHTYYPIPKCSVSSSASKQNNYRSRRKWPHLLPRCWPRLIARRRSTSGAYHCFWCNEEFRERDLDGEDSVVDDRVVRDSSALSRLMSLITYHLARQRPKLEGVWHVRVYFWARVLYLGNTAELDYDIIKPAVKLRIVFRPATLFFSIHMY